MYNSSFKQKIINMCYGRIEFIRNFFLKIKKADRANGTRERESGKKRHWCARVISRVFLLFLVLSFIFQKVHHTSIFQRTQRNGVGVVVAFWLAAK